MADPRPIEDQPLREILWELRPYLDELVIIGGWVPYLYRKYGGFSSWQTTPPFTREVDILVPPVVPRRGRDPISRILRISGFEPLGRTRPPAVWAKDPEVGEKIEFLTAHIGPADRRAQITPVEDQDEMGAVSLERLEFLRSHTQVLQIYLGRYWGDDRHADVRIPLLGAYIINKAVTFPLRRSLAEGADNPKRAKDILYLRDILAAGHEVVAHVQDDLRRIGQSSRADRFELENARNTVNLALDGSWDGAQRQAAEMLAEETGDSQGDDLADIRGHLTDLVEIINEVLEELSF